MVVDANPLKDMVGPNGLEPLTSTVSTAVLGFTTTYKTPGTAKVRGSRTRHRILWVGLWVGIFPRNYWCVPFHVSGLLHENLTFPSQSRT